MAGQGILRECLLDPGVHQILSVVRTPSGQQHPKLRELVHANFFDYSVIESQLSGFDACFFSLGVSSAGMDEAKYTHLTYDLTLAASATLARLNPQMTFVYISGAGTDSTERGRSMWARVKGKTENDLLKLPFHAAYMFRPDSSSPSTASAQKPGSTSSSTSRSIRSFPSSNPHFLNPSPPPRN